MIKQFRVLTAVGLALILAVTSMLAAGTAKGTLAFKAKTRSFDVALRFAYLVKGPDAVDPKLTIRRVILSSTDVEKKLAACATMNCTADESIEGVSIDLDAGPRLNYWITLNDGLVQYSGTVAPSSLKTTADTATRLAGHWTLDSLAAGGGKADVEFDAPLLKTFTKAR
jgi:hypothetical protein